MGLQYGTLTNTTREFFLFFFSSFFLWLGWDESTIGHNVPIGGIVGAEGAQLDVRSAPFAPPKIAGGA